MPLKIMIASAPPWALTGYGQQMASLIPRLQADGHEVAMVPLGGFHGGYARINGVDYLPPDNLADKGNNGIMEAYAKVWGADLVLSLTDAWILDQYGAGRFRWVPWVPVDGDPLGPAIAKVLPNAWRTIAMSRHGHKTMADAGFQSTYIPHGFEDVFKPDLAAGRKFRKEFWPELPEDAFVFGSVGLNYAYPGRKGFDRLLEAFKAFSEGKENVYLYIHADPRPMQSLDLDCIVRDLGLEGKVLFPRLVSYIIGYRPDTLASMYNALDCFVLATHGEGFGIPVLEALACGVPVIATDCTSMKELVQDTVNGTLVPPVTAYMNAGHYRHYLIDVEKLTEAMEDAYHEEFFPGVMGTASGKAGMLRAARFPNLKLIARKTVEGYLWDTLYSQFWRPFLDDCEREIRAKDTPESARSGGEITVMEDRVRKTEGPGSDTEREYGILKTLDHPNIVKPIDSGKDEWGRFWFEMPRYPVSLADAEDYDTAKVLEGLKAALDYLHGQGLAHRDVHEHNVMLTEDGEPVLIDFGWAVEAGNAHDIDFRPWVCPSDLTPRSQMSWLAGYHRVVSFVRGIDLTRAEATGLRDFPYQALDGVGERDCDLRWALMAPDVKGKHVLDIGCNLGYFVRKSLEEGAEEAVGIDHDPPTIDAAKTLGPGTFYVRDLNKWSVTMLGNPERERFDVAFALSVLQHLENPDQVLQDLLAVADEVYVEQPEGSITDYMRGVFASAETLGKSERHRPVFRITSRVEEGVPA